ncbi:MAG: PadR family transcriptional regulator [Tunicatimonas sp.]|uniref:PadR family transcriptional regulator n=1 Tax=Tunicatimonas sp. TaxID=1940096 RepID=UPI003C75CDD0
MYSSELIKGTVTTLILKLLSDNRRMYGYQITQAITKATDGKITLTLAAIYPVLHKLKAKGELTTEKEKVGNRLRIYYSLTDQGNDTARAKLKEFADYLATMKSLLEIKPGLQKCLTV